MVWELSQDVRNLEIRCKKQENDIAYEKRINVLLSERLSNLEKSLETEATFLHERLHGIRKHPVHSRFKGPKKVPVSPGTDNKPLEPLVQEKRVPGS
jgi:hypothetical protein